MYICLLGLLGKSTFDQVVEATYVTVEVKALFLIFDINLCMVLII